MILIDADSLYNALGNKLTWLMGYGSDVYLGVGDDIRDVIKEQSTAYDIDKVVEELEAIKGYACYGMNCNECKYTHDCFEGEKSEEKAIDKAIEIVKHGGIFDDVCE